MKSVPESNEKGMKIVPGSNEKTGKHGSQGRNENFHFQKYTW
jgi:hypothetical protein